MLKIRLTERVYNEVLRKLETTRKLESEREKRRRLWGKMIVHILKGLGL